MTRICHLSSAHSGLDVRIFMKECVSLAKAGYEVHLVIQAGDAIPGEAALNGVTLHKLNAASNRLERMLKQAWRCFSLARGIDAEVYHFHDPELIPWGMLLALTGKKVVYDVHEDVPKQIRSKAWIPALVRAPLSGGVAILEWVGAQFFFSVVAATPHIRDRFRRINPGAIDINNFPLPGEFDSSPLDWPRKQSQIAYVGGITRIRGIQEVVAAMALVQSEARLQLAGEFSEPDFERQIKQERGWGRVDELGLLSRARVGEVLRRSVAGLVTFRPEPNHVDAQPNKMFEYMSAGVPVIASDFPLWRDIVEGARCGICVDPLIPQEIAQAIDHLIAHPAEAEQMGRNGQRAVRERYNWSIEERKLLDFYREMINGTSADPRQTP
jgi:glycosyltransferase involved in cell wall biosynthesis